MWLGSWLAALHIRFNFKIWSWVWTIRSADACTHHQNQYWNLNELSYNLISKILIPENSSSPAEPKTFPFFLSLCWETDPRIAIDCLCWETNPRIEIQLHCLATQTVHCCQNHTMRSTVQLNRNGRNYITFNAIYIKSTFWPFLVSVVSCIKWIYPDLISGYCGKIILMLTHMRGVVR